MGSYEPDRQAVAHRKLAADSPVLQRRHDDAVYGHRRHAVLDDATQRAIQIGAGEAQRRTSRGAGVRAARAARHRPVDVVATPKPNLDVTANFTTQKHSGELPWASFGFSNDVEVALPYDSRANDFTIGTEWTNTTNMLRVAYSGSWFDNLAPTLTWDSPLRLDDIAGTPGRGRMSLWPSNSAQTISFGGYTKLAQDAGDRLLLLRPVEQRRAAPAVHDQFGGAAVRTAAREHGGGRARASRRT